MGKGIAQHQSKANFSGYTSNKQSRLQSKDNHLG